MQIVGACNSCQVWPERLDDGIAVHSVALGQGQQFQQRARLVEPPDAGRNDGLIDLNIEAAQHRDANPLWRHALSVSPFP